GSTTAPAAGPAGTDGATGPTTDGTDSVLGGTQAVAPLSLPVTVGGNAISGVGDSTSTGSAVMPGTSGTDGVALTSGDNALLGGSQLVLPVSLPITLGGNAIAVIGDSTTTGPVPGTPGGPGDPGDPGDPG